MLNFHIFLPKAIYVDLKVHSYISNIGCFYWYVGIFLPIITFTCTCMVLSDVLPLVVYVSVDL